MLADKVAPDWEKAKDATVLVVNIFVIAGFLFLLARSLKGCEQLNGVGNQCSGWNDANYHYDDGEPVVFLNCKLSNDKLCEGCTGCSFQKNGMGYCVEPLYACVTKQDGKFLIIIETVGLMTLTAVFFEGLKKYRATYVTLSQEGQ